MTARQHTAAVVFVLLASLVLAVVIGQFVYEAQPWKDPARVARIIERMGPYAPVAYVALVAIATIIPPVPDSVPIIVAGAGFGPFIGGVYALGGIVVGTSVSFHLAHRYGRRFLERHMGRDTSSRFDDYVKSMGWNAVFMGTLIGINSGLLSYAGGMANMRFASFLSATLLGALPHVFLFTMAGQALRGNTLLLIVGALALVMIGSLLRTAAYRIAARRRPIVRSGRDGTHDGDDGLRDSMEQQGKHTR